MANNYLFIFEDGSIQCGNDMTNDEINSVIDGYLDIIDITDPANPKKLGFDYDDTSASPIFYPIESKNSD
jgi:hypothetical protein